MAKPRSGSSRVSESSEISPSCQTCRSRRQAQTSARAVVGSSVAVGGGSGWSGQHHGVDEQDDGTDEEGRPVPPADGRGERQQERPEEVAHLGRDGARRQHGDQVVVAGEVDERHLAGREQRVGRDTEQERARGQDPEAVPQAPAGHADRVAEGAEGGLGPAAHPVGRDRADPAGQATDGHEDEQDGELLVGQVEVDAGAARASRPGGTRTTRRTGGRRRGTPPSPARPRPAGAGATGGDGGGGDEVSSATCGPCGDP